MAEQPHFQQDTARPIESLFNKLDEMKQFSLTRLQDFFNLPGDMVDSTRSVPVTVANVEQIKDRFIDIANPERQAAKIINQQRASNRKYGVRIPLPNKQALVNAMIEHEKAEFNNFGGVWMQEAEQTGWLQNLVKRVFKGTSSASATGEIYLNQDSNIDGSYALQHELFHALSRDGKRGTGLSVAGTIDTGVVANEMVTEVLNISSRLGTKDLGRLMAHAKNPDVVTGYSNQLSAFTTMLTFLEKMGARPVSVDEMSELYFDRSMDSGVKKALFNMRLSESATHLPSELRSKVEEVLALFGLGPGAGKLRENSRAQQSGIAKY